MAEGRYGRSQDRNPGVEVRDCKDCGALVVDMEAHDRLHVALDEAASLLAALEESRNSRG